MSEIPVSNSKVDRTSHPINSCNSDPFLLINISAGAPVNLLQPGPPPVTLRKEEVTNLVLK